MSLKVYQCGQCGFPILARADSQAAWLFDLHKRTCEGNGSKDEIADALWEFATDFGVPTKGGICNSLNVR